MASSDAEGARRKEDRSLYRRPTHNRFAFADVSAPSWELRSCAAEAHAHTPSSKKPSRGLRSLEGSVKSCARCCACCSPIKFYPSSIQVQYYAQSSSIQFYPSSILSSIQLYPPFPERPTLHTRQTLQTLQAFQTHQTHQTFSAHQTPQTPQTHQTPQAHSSLRAVWGRPSPTLQKAAYAAPGVAGSSMGDRELAAGSSWEARSREQPGAARSSRELGTACSRKQPGAVGNTTNARPKSY